MKALFYSIQPEYILHILNGNKTIEVRKRDLPKWAKDKLARGEKVIGYGYCTKGKPYLSTVWGKVVNGLVVVKFEVSDRDIYFPNIHDGYHHMFHHIGAKTCLSQIEITQYGKGKDLYAHHITNVQPVEMELDNFYSFGSQEHHDFITTSTMIQEDERETFIKSYKLRKPPQSFMTVWVKGE